MSEEWPLMSLLELTRPDGLLSDGDWVESKDQDASGTNRLIQLADLGDGIFLNKSSRFLNDEQFSRLQCTPLRVNDVLVSRMADPLGRACLFPGVSQRSATVVDVAIIRPSPTKADPRWLANAINAPATREAIQAEASGTTRARVSRSRLAEIQIPTPPLDEQRRIVAKLDALRARSRRAKEALDAVPALLDRLRQSILAAAFRGDLTADWREANPDVEPASELLKRIRIERRKRWEEAELAKMVAKGKPPQDDRWKSKYVEPEPVDESELPELPEGWCWASLESIARVENGDRGKEYPTGADFVPSGVPFVNAGHIRAGRVDMTNMNYVTGEKLNKLGGARIEEGDILYCLRGSLGKCALAHNGLFGTVGSSLAVVRPSALVSRELLLAYFDSPLGRAMIDRHDNGTAQPNLSAGSLSRFTVPLAPHQEQIAMSASVRQVTTVVIDRLAQAALQAERALSELDASILVSAFHGELLDRHNLAADI